MGGKKVRLAKRPTTRRSHSRHGSRAHAFAISRCSADARILSDAAEHDRVAFLLAPHRGGLYVECERYRGKTVAVVTMQFADQASFRKWCEGDRLQLTYPLLYANLKRSGSELFRA